MEAVHFGTGSRVSRPDPPEHSAEDVLAALEVALTERRAAGEPLTYFEASKAWRAVIRRMGWIPGHDLGQGPEYAVTISHPGAGAVGLVLDTREPSERKPS